MQIPIPTAVWRVLRQAVRARRPATGSALRIDMSQRTKVGSFLTDLVRYGLLQVVTSAENPFDATYALTERGKFAADHGVYEVDFEEYKRLRMDS